MTIAALEHINLTVADADQTAQRLCRIFGWSVRWAGQGIHGSRSVHIGGDKSYLAVYSQTAPGPGIRTNYVSANQINHIGITVDDLEAAERRIIQAGYKPYSHADYEPGRRFYFRDEDGVEYEVISYARAKQKTSNFWAVLGQLAQNAAIVK